MTCLECSCHVKVMWRFSDGLLFLPFSAGDMGHHSQGTKTWQGQKKSDVACDINSNAEVLGKISSAGQSYIKCSIPLNYSLLSSVSCTVTWAVRQRSMLIRRASVSSRARSNLSLFLPPLLFLPSELSDSQEVCSTHSASSGRSWAGLASCK